MKKVNDNDMEKVAGGKEEFSKVGESFNYIKRTCDDCGKLLNEEVKPLDDAGDCWGFNSSYKLHEFDCGLDDDDCKVNLCYECYKKRLMKK